MSWSKTSPEDVPSSETVRGLPREHWGCHLSNFDFSVLSNGDAKWAAVAAFMDEHENGDAPHLLLLGREGAGKSHIATGLYRWAVYRYDLSYAAFVHVPSFSHAYKKSFRGDAPDPFDDIEGSRFLVLDDPFGRQPSDWELAQVIPRLVDIAYRERMSLVVTANQDRKAFRRSLEPHEVSRLFDGAIEIRFFEEADYRLRRRG